LRPSPVSQLFPYTTLFRSFHAARLVASLDHISKGRIGWNVVTSMFDAEARNHGFDAMPGHDWRYARADEFIQVVLDLWDSWGEGDRKSTRLNSSHVKISYA